MYLIQRKAVFENWKCVILFLNSDWITALCSSAFSATSIVKPYFQWHVEKSIENLLGVLSRDWRLQPVKDRSFLLKNRIYGFFHNSFCHLRIYLSIKQNNWDTPLGSLTADFNEMLMMLNVPVSLRSTSHNRQKTKQVHVFLGFVECL